MLELVFGGGLADEGVDEDQGGVVRIEGHGDGLTGGGRDEPGRGLTAGRGVGPRVGEVVSPGSVGWRGRQPRSPWVETHVYLRAVATRRCPAPSECEGAVRRRSGRWRVIWGTGRVFRGTGVVPEVITGGTDWHRCHGGDRADSEGSGPRLGSSRQNSMVLCSTGLARGGGHGCLLVRAHRGVPVRGAEAAPVR